ncbi:MAG: alanine--tRNA ligase [Actinomycetota bacterium]|nr:alanine--tRNA ligase [Actinomycetota bacterium]
MSTPVGGAEVRRAFLEFFAERGHPIVPSASLIPVDPSLLLTVAGMVPFKPYLLGEETPPYRRAVSSQKCIRTNDIDLVGLTARHMSFFEMLGNFSFGDYFKEQAIPWAFELVTEVYGMDPDRLWFTVHETDDDAAEIWIETVGASPDRVQRRDRDNFWQMGVAGPAGLSSEIFYDRGARHGPDGGPLVDEERFMEIWNLVFMQYLQDEPYHVIGDLPARNIDTGSGLERVSLVLQEVDTSFLTDLLRPVVAAAEAATGVTYGARRESDVSLSIMADHGRGFTFLIGDGVVPSNEGRGYVLRRLLRRTIRHAWQLGAEKNITQPLVKATIQTLGDAYPALRASEAGILETAEREEQRFRRTLESGHSLLSAELEQMDAGATLSGETAFKLHDTFGFPVELTEEIAAERGVELDRHGFDAEMAAQRERARTARGKSAVADAPKVYRDIYDESGPTRFLGYEQVDTQGTVLAIVADGDPIQTAEEGQDVEVFFDVTTFYAESGGQVGDTGTATTETGVLQVTDTQHAVQDLHGHRATVRSGSISVGQVAALSVDPGRRERIRKSHSGTHILHWALRTVVGPHVQQAGSLVEPGRLRFDFSHYEGLTDEEVFEVERLANERVIENAHVRAFQVTRKEAEEMGALAFFGDKYGDVVRIVEAGSYSRELCGGTHVHTTGQVGPLVVVGESSIGSNLRRIEAYTGSAGYGYFTELRRKLRATADSLRVQPEKVDEAAAALAVRSREQEARIAQIEAQTRSEAAEDLVESAEEVDGRKLVIASREGLSPDALRQLGMQVRDRIGSGIAVLGSSRDGKASLVVVVSRDLVTHGANAAEIAGPAAKLLGGGSSRDPEMAQAGGPQGDRLGDGVEAAARLARESLGRF